MGFVGSDGLRSLLGMRCSFYFLGCLIGFLFYILGLMSTSGLSALVARSMSSSRTSKISVSYVDRARTLISASASGLSRDAIIPTSENARGPTIAMARQPRSAFTSDGMCVSGATIDSSFWV